MPKSVERFCQKRGLVRRINWNKTSYPLVREAPVHDFSGLSKGSRFAVLSRFVCCHYGRFFPLAKRFNGEIELNAIKFIELALENGKNRALKLIGDMKDAPLTRPTNRGGNHPLWVLGHLLYSESMLIDGFICGKPNRFAKWEGLFGIGSVPSDDAGRYPTLDDLTMKFDEMRSATLAFLQTIGDEDLDKPSQAPTQFGKSFATIGGILSAATSHVNFHAGQVADSRRAAGRPPLMF